MESLRRVENAWHASAAVTESGWICAAVRMPDPDTDFLSEFGRYSACFREGASEAEWSEAVCALPQQLQLLRMKGGEVNSTELSRAAKVGPPHACGGNNPAVAWTECDSGEWRVRCWINGECKTLRRQNSPCHRAGIAPVGDGFLVAAEDAKPDRRGIILLHSSGEELTGFEGRRPRLAALDGERCLLATELRLAPERVVQKAWIIEAGKAPEPVEVPRAGDYAFNADLATTEDGTAYMVHESCPSWGYDERVALHRNLYAFILPAGESAFRGAPGTLAGRVPLKLQAFADRSRHNLSHVYPRILPFREDLAIAYRQFRPYGSKCYGWDTLLAICSAGSWSAPIRLSEAAGHADAGYSVLPAADETVTAFLPGCEQTPVAWWAEVERGENPPYRGAWAFNHHLAIVRADPETAPPPVSAPETRAATVAIPPAITDAAPAPPSGLRQADRQLIWGDLHAHTAYSKCMSANDGQPQDVLRFQRDVLGCQVLCLTDHVEYMRAPEFAHVLDCLEEEAGSDCIPLYGVEWAKRPAHHTNFYALDRNVFDRLRALMLVCDNLPDLYARIKAELPPSSVVAIRHMHGMDEDEFGVSGPRVTETHDPQLEWCMEAMQTRGNMMLKGHGGALKFPNNFLNAEAKIGLIAGSDHSRGGGPNRWCMTGFWVDEISPGGVFRALRERSTIACANAKVAIWTEAEGAPMGSAIAVSDEVRIRASLCAARPIRRVCLMRDGECLDWIPVNCCEADMEFIDSAPQSGEHWYSVTAEAEAALTPHAIVHSSPYFVTVG